MNETSPSLRDRSALARIGVVALNVLTPGLGLIRVGRWREGLKVAAGSQLPLWLIGVTTVLLPPPNFVGVIAIVALASLVPLAVLLIGCVRTWRISRDEFDGRWWSRWYALILWYAISWVSASAAIALFHASYHAFYVASISMEPTLRKNEKIFADMHWRTPQLGGIVLVRDRDGDVRIDRIAALGGQTFAMRNGVPIINGHAAVQAVTGRITVSDNGIDAQSGRVLSEQLPGETGTHRIAQLAGDALDDVKPLRVPADSIYLLGDDRDMSADSRYPPELNGLGIVPASAIVGRPLYVLWNRDRHRIGQRADH